MPPLISIIKPKDKFIITNIENKAHKQAYQHKYQKMSKKIGSLL